MFERRDEPLISRGRFAARVAICLCLAATLAAAALAVGAIGYHAFAGLGWVDAFLNASMILTGMGPVSPMPSDGAKLFASFYALFSGLFFITIIAIVLAPLAHRVLHRFHIAEEDL